jgi:hypothetical protein
VSGNIDVIALDHLARDVNPIQRNEREVGGLRSGDVQDVEAEAIGIGGDRIEHGLEGWRGDDTHIVNVGVLPRPTSSGGQYEPSLRSRIVSKLKMVEEV